MKPVPVTAIVVAALPASTVEGAMEAIVSTFEGAGVEIPEFPLEQPAIKHEKNADSCAPPDSSALHTTSQSEHLRQSYRELRRGDWGGKASRYSAIGKRRRVAETSRQTPVFPYGNMHVVESTGAEAAKTKLSDLVYAIEKITPKAGHVPCMILTTKRLGKSGFHVSVMRV